MTTTTVALLNSVDDLNQKFGCRQVKTFQYFKIGGIFLLANAGKLASNIRLMAPHY